MSKRRMGLIAAGTVVAVVLAAAIAMNRWTVDSDESGTATGGAVEPSSSNESSSPNSVFLALGGGLPSRSTRAGFVPTTIDGRRVAQMMPPSTVAFRLAPDATRYEISLVAHLSGAARAPSLVSSLDGRALSPWPLREGWSLYSSSVDRVFFDGGSAGKRHSTKADTHELVLTIKDLQAGATIEVESLKVAPVLDRVSFDTGPQSDGHWIDGFHRRERGAIWSRGLKSAIGVVVEPRNVPYRLKVRGRTLAGLSPLIVKTRVNEREVGSVEVTSKVDDVTWEVPGGVLASGANRIEFEYPKTGQPAAFNLSSRDTRELAFRISSVELAPMD